MSRWQRAAMGGVLVGVLVACGRAPSVPPSPTTISTAAPPTVPLPAEVAGSVDPPPAAASRQLPRATLTTEEGVAQMGVLGAYCWAFEGESMTCGGPEALAVPTVALSVAPGEAMTFVLPRDVPPELVTLRVLGWQPEADKGAQTIIAVDAPLLASGDLPPEPSIAWEAPPEPGDYVLDLTMTYRDGGTLSYGWHIAVTPP